MSECPSTETLSRLVSGELDGDTLERIEAHLRECLGCRQRLDSMTFADDVLRGNRRSGTSFPGMPQNSDVESDESMDQILRRLKATRPDRRTEHRTRDENSAETADSDSNADYQKLEALSEVLHYRVLEAVGSGVSGQLFRAYDTQLEREVALKVLHPSLLQKPAAWQRLQREAKAMAGLSHQNIVTLHGFESAEGFPPFLVLEFVDGQTLEEQIHRDGPLEARLAAQTIASVASALQAAHQAGVIHRDVKSSNILVDRGMRPRITDFGLARNTDSDSRLTTEGMIAGTPAYMSPEQITDPSGVDAISDTYSLGIVLYETLTGVLPFQGTTRMTLAQVLHNEPLPPRRLNDRVPTDLETVCLKAIAKEPGARYQSAEEMGQDLQRFLENRPVQARRVGWTGRAMKWCQRNPRIAWLWAAVAASFLLATAISITSAVRLRIANDGIRQSEQQARRNALVAAEQRDASLKTLRRLLVDVPKAIKDSDDLSDVEKLVSQIALDGLSQVAQSGQESQRLDLHTAMGHFQLGATYWQANELESANQHLNKAIETLRLLNDDDSAADERDALLAETNIYLGYVAEETGSSDDGRPYIESAMALCDGLLERDPENFRGLLCKASCLEWIAEDEVSRRNIEEGQAKADLAGQILDQLLENHPDSNDVYLHLSEHDAVIDYIRSAAKIQRLSDKKLNNRYKRAMKAAETASRDKDAEELYNALYDAREFGDELIARNAEEPTLESIVEITKRLADVSRYLGYSNDAHSFYEEVLEHYQSGSSTPSEEDILRARAGVVLSLAEAGFSGEVDRKVESMLGEMTELETLSNRQRMDLIDLMIQRTYDPDIDDADVEDLAKSISEEYQQLKAIPQITSLPIWPEWRRATEDEIDSLKDFE